MPWPTPALSAQIRPPCASTSPLQMASPRPRRIPSLPWSRAVPEYLRNRWGNCSGATPVPLSEIDTATYTPSHCAATRMGEPSGECRAALASRLFNTCTMRRRSAITRGRPQARSTRNAWRPPPLKNALLACSINTSTSEGSGDTGSVPVSMRPTSSRLATSSRISSTCSSMTRWNARTSAGSSFAEPPSSVAVEPLIAASGVRSSWLTSSRNSVRCRSSASSGARSCMATTTDSTVPASLRIGVMLTSVRTLRPSGTESTSSSARIVSARVHACAIGHSRTTTSSRPAKRQVTTSINSSSEPPGPRSAPGDAPGLAVERHQPAGPAVEHDNPHRRGVDQRLEVGARSSFSAVRTRVGDRRRGVMGKQHQHLVVLARELASPLLLPEKEVSDMAPVVAHRSTSHVSRVNRQRSEPERAHVGVAFVRREPRGDEVLQLPLVVHRRDDAVARADEGARAVDDFLQHGIDIETRADAQARLAKRRESLAQRHVFPRQLPKSIGRLTSHAGG